MAFPIDQVISQAGQINKAGDSRALFLKEFGGEVLTLFKHSHLALNLTRVRTISSGKSAQFPMIGGTSAKYHKPGTLIEADAIGHIERTVTIDDIAISPVFIPSIQEAMAHYEYRGQYVENCSFSLSDLVDRNVFRMIAKASFITDASAAAAAGLQVLPEQKYTANIQLAAAGDELVGKKLVDALFKARTELRKANIRKQANVVFSPEQIEALTNIAQADAPAITWLNKDIAGSTQDGLLGNAMGNLPICRIAGFNIYESNNLPNQDESLGLVTDPEPLSDVAFGSGNAAKYRGDFSKLVGLVFVEDAVATTKLMDLTVKHVEEPLRIGDTILAKLAVGHDILRFECAISILAA